MAETVPKLPTSAPWSGSKSPALRGVVQRYGIAIVAFALALGLKFLLASLLPLRGEASYLFFLPAILIASALADGVPVFWRRCLASCSAFFSSSIFAR